MTPLPAVMLNGKHPGNWPYSSVPSPYPYRDAPVETTTMAKQPKMMKSERDEVNKVYLPANIFFTGVLRPCLFGLPRIRFERNFPRKACQARHLEFFRLRMTRL